MAAGNTKFRAENGLDVIGTANVSGSLRVEGDLAVNGNLLTALNLVGDLKPTSNNTLYLGSTGMRWGVVYANSADFTGTLLVAGDTTLNTVTSNAFLPTANSIGLGSAVRRWDIYGNNASLISANVGANVNISTTQLSIGNATGNSVLTQSTLTVGNTTTGTINAFALNISGVAATGNVTVTGFINSSSYGSFNGTVNATAINVGANINISTTQINIGNSTVNTVITSTSIASPATLAIGNTTVTGFANISSTLNVTGAATVNGATTINNTLAAGNTTVTGFVNASSYGTFNGTVNATALNIGANVNISTTQLNIGNSTGNSVLTQSTLTIGNSSVGTINAYALNIGTGNATFRTDLLTLDGTNNRIGLKTGLASLSTSALATITGNLEFSTINTGIRLQTSNASMNASITVAGNTTNTRTTFNTFDSGTSTISGGFSFTGTNATSTQALLDINSTLLQYKSGNVAHSGNFGIYNVSGTRLGP